MTSHSLLRLPESLRWPDHLAAIDLGSNSFRLEIGQLSAGRYKRIDYLKETVRLGAGLDATGTLTEEAIQRGLACLARFGQRLRDYDPVQVRGVATQTLREAVNRDEFLARAQTVLGHSIEVISGREEARLIFAGVARLQPSDDTRLVIDIGGRSTEMILGHGRTPLSAESFQVGSVSLSMRFFSDGQITKAAFRDAQIAAGAELEEALESFDPKYYREVLGASGTVGAVSQMLAASGVTDGTITPEGLRWCITQCLEAGCTDKLGLPGLKDDRRPVIAGGLAILYTLATQFGIDKIQPARGALRQGVIFELGERLHAEIIGGDREGSHDMRDATVRDLQRRFEVDVAQAERVARVAERLYASVAPYHDVAMAGDLRWACALHEIGMMVSRHDHHRHSAYLMGQVDAAGFSQSQQQRLSNLLLAQRGGLGKVAAVLAQEPFAWAVLCLRLAIIKCHARSEVNVALWQLQRQGTTASLVFTPEWVEANPRTMFLLNEEVATWSRSEVLRFWVQF